MNLDIVNRKSDTFLSVKLASHYAHFGAGFGYVDATFMVLRSRRFEGKALAIMIS